MQSVRTEAEQLNRVAVKKTSGGYQTNDLELFTQKFIDNILTTAINSTAIDYDSNILMQHYSADDDDDGAAAGGAAVAGGNNDLEQIAKAFLAKNPNSGYCKFGKSIFCKKEIQKFIATQLNIREQEEEELNVIMNFVHTTSPQ